MRENYCMLLGQLSKDPEVSFELEESGDKKYYAGILEVMVCRQIIKKDSDGNPAPANKWDYLTVFTRNHDIIEREILELKKGDLVRVKGSISTREVVRRHICKECRYMNEYPGIILYLDPLSIQKVSENIPEEDAILSLQDAGSHSNTVHLAGFVTMEPRCHEYEENPARDVLEFSIAGNRIRRILEDEDTRRTDFPWIKMYGSLAKENAGLFGRGTEIYINGTLQKRKPAITRKCFQCGAEGEEITDIMEVVPRSIQIIRYPDEKNEF